MKTTMDRAGRLVIPKAARVEAGLRPHEPLTVRVREGRIEIEPAPRDVRLESKGGFLVAEAVDPSSPLTRDDVRRTRRDVREGTRD